jgi:hypothetical protein
MRHSPDALVTVHLLPSEGGGRVGPTPDKAFGCIMTIDGVNLDVRFRLGHDGPLQPGSTRDVEIDFLDPDFATSHLRIGEEFKLREVSVIGSGTIKHIYMRQRRHA